MDITVLTPAYNRGGGIQRLYASLDKQYNKNFEWMIVDDGSTDDTAQVVKELQESSDFKIRYIYKRRLSTRTMQIPSSVTWIVRFSSAVPNPVR